MPTPPNSNQGGGYISPFGTSGGGINPFAFFNAAQGFSFGNQNNRGNRRSPFAEFGPAVMGQPPGGGSMESVMSSKGYRKTSDGYVRIDGTGRRHVMKEGDAQKLYGGQGMNLGQQAAAGAFADWQMLSGVLGQQNQQRADHLNSLQMHRAQLEQDRQSMVGEIANQTGAHAQEIKDLADSNLGKWEEYRDKIVGNSQAYAKKIEGMVQGYINSYDENALASISATAGGIAAAAESDIQNIRNQASALGLDPSVASAMEFRARGEASRQMQGMVSSMQDQKNQFKLQAGLQGAGIVGSAYAQAAGTERDAMQGTLAALGRQEQNYQVANQWIQAGRAQAVEANLRFEQAKIEVGNQIAGALSNLTQKYPSLYDTFLQAGFATQNLGRVGAFQLG